MTRNQLQYWSNKETERANKAREAETTRANRVNAAIQTQIAAETKRHQLATEKEANRANLASERLKSQSNSISAQQVAATQAHYQRSDATSLLSANNSRYAANLNYSAQMSNLYETTRHNKQQEQTQGFGAVANAVTGLLGVGAKIGGLLK